jgi:hypothetical protein
LYQYTYIHIHICIYTHTYIYTHTQIYIIVYWNSYAVSKGEMKKIVKKGEKLREAKATTLRRVLLARSCGMGGGRTWWERLRA